jgi:RNA polymerase sigma-70 factor (ECF subfamily)
MDKRLLKTLIKKAQRGDKRSFEELYRVFIKNIFYHTGNLLDDKDEIEDAVQEIVYKMYRGIRELKQAEAFTAWMHRIITTTCINRNVKNGRTGNYYSLENYSDSLREDDDEALPEEFALKRNQNEILADVIAQLPPARRQAVIMYYYDDMSYKEIAEALEVTVSTVSTNILKAKRTIVNEMNKRNGSESSAIDKSISAFFVADANSLYSDEALAQFCANFDKGLGSIVTGHSAAGKGLGLKIGLVGLSAAAVAGSALYLYSGADYEQQITERLTDPFVPAAVIELTGNDCPDGHVNPQEADLLIQDGEGRVIDWRISQGGDNAAASSAVVRRGSGDRITSELQDLPEGVYQITWVLENAEGNRASVMRDILIIEGAVAPGAYE